VWSRSTCGRDELGADAARVGTIWLTDLRDRNFAHTQCQGGQIHYYIVCMYVCMYVHHTGARTVEDIFILPPTYLHVVLPVHDPSPVLLLC